MNCVLKGYSIIFYSYILKKIRISSAYTDFSND